MQLNKEVKVTGVTKIDIGVSSVGADIPNFVYGG